MNSGKSGGDAALFDQIMQELPSKVITTGLTYAATTCNSI